MWWHKSQRHAGLNHAVKAHAELLQRLCTFIATPEWKSLQLLVYAATDWAISYPVSNV